MNRSQKIALGVGAVWAIATAMLPPVLIPASRLGGATHSFIELASWNSGAVRNQGVCVGYFVVEIVAIIALTLALVYFLKTQPARPGRRR